MASSLGLSSTKLQELGLGWKEKSIARVYFPAISHVQAFDTGLVDPEKGILLLK